MKAIILVGGFGTRLRPLTLTHPKPLLPILNRPFISFQLELLAKFGVKRVVLAVGPHLGVWKGALSKWVPKGQAVTLSVEKKPMGTGGAIRLAYNKSPSKTKEEPYIIFNGDIFFNLDIKSFLNFHRKKLADGSVALTKVNNMSLYGSVFHGKDGRIRKFIEKDPKKKPGWINAGAYILSSNLIKRIPCKPLSIERDIFPNFLKENLRLFAYPISGYWNDIGTPDSYLKAHQDLLTNQNFRPSAGGFQKHLGKTIRGRNFKVLIGRKAKLGKKIGMRGFVCIGEKVQIGDESFIQNSVIHDGADIGKHVKMIDSIIGRNSRIGDHAEI
ncbi:MAG: NDP-sugar synthase, partial [Elusimicrobia bacterium]|nr:NDP-sugar synthase [Candidatus Obscuribacterium magneticum]